VKAGGRQRSETGAATLRALRSVLHATGGNAKLLELYRVMPAEEAAVFLGLALQTVRNMTARHELPCIRTGKRGVGYRVIDLIDWQERRLQPTAG
jgi:excisionase family DNA binding protein